MLKKCQIVKGTLVYKIAYNVYIDSLNKTLHIVYSACLYKTVYIVYSACLYKNWKVYSACLYKNSINGLKFIPLKNCKYGLQCMPL